MLPLCKLDSFLFLYPFVSFSNVIYKPVLSAILSENVGILFSYRKTLMINQSLTSRLLLLVPKEIS